MDTIFQIVNRNIFEYIITFLDQYDICNLRITHKNKTLNKVYAKVKEYCTKRAKMIFVSDEVIYCDTCFRFYYDEDMDKIENYYISKIFNYSNHGHPVYNNSLCNSCLQLDNYYNSVIDFLNSKIPIFKKLKIEKGDVVCFQCLPYNDVNTRYKYIYNGSKFIEIGKFSPEHFMHKKYNPNYWEYVLEKHVKPTETKYIKELGCCVYC